VAQINTSSSKYFNCFETRNCSVRGGWQPCILCWEGPSGYKYQAREINEWEKDQCWGYRGDQRSMIQPVWEKCTHGKSRIKMVIAVGFSKCVSWRQWEGGGEDEKYIRWLGTEKEKKKINADSIATSHRWNGLVLACRSVIIELIKLWYSRKRYHVL